MVNLSASKIDTYNTCSWLYYALYHLNLPRSQNEGAKRGDVTHIILESLINPRHKKNFDRILAAKSIRADKAVWRLTRKHCKRLGIWDTDNVKMVNGFVMVALEHNFYGDSSVKKTLPEKAFMIKVEEEDKKYCINGYIDKIFIKESKTGAIFVEIYDYKTSKEKFAGDKATFNIQDYVYNIAARHLFPEAQDYNFCFLFLKFADDPLVRQKKLSDDQVEGFEYILTDLTEELEKFDMSKAKKNLAAAKGWPKPGAGFGGLAKCGYAKFPGDANKEGKPYYYCEAKFAQDYYVVVNKDGVVVGSSAKKDELDAAKGKIEKRHYKGCPYFNK